jgi:GT2 family glycosyltransferase
MAAGKPMTDHPHVSVVIPHYNDLDRLALCLAALDQQTFPRANYEIVVADNRSSCGLDAVAALVAGRARVVDAPDPGAGPARNVGVEAARGVAIAFTDCDCIPEPDWLANGVGAMARGDLVGGKMVVLVRDEANVSGAEAFERVFAFNNERYVVEENFSVTANLFCKRDDFFKIGRFRVGVSEDIEWCWRAHAAGFTIVYAGDAIVGHPARETYADLLKKWRRMNKELYFLTKPGFVGSLYWLGRTWLLLPSIFVQALKVLTTPQLRGARQRLGALVTLVRIRLWRFFDSHRRLLQSRDVFPAPSTGADAH